MLSQVEHGAQFLQVFESSAEHLTREQFENFSAPFLKTISDGVKSKLTEKNIPHVPMVGTYCILLSLIK